MGTFCGYDGTFVLPEDKKQEFSEHMMKILYYGGMMDFDVVKMFGNELGLLVPVQLNENKKAHFYYNYFEDDSWESAGFDADTGKLWSGKTGTAEFCDVMLAGYILCEIYSDKFCIASCNGDIIKSSIYVGWINHLCKTGFSMEKRFLLWENAEKENFEYIKREDDNRQIHILDLIPEKLIYGAGGTELADLLYIEYGTEDLTEDAVKSGTYPADVLRCRKVLEQCTDFGRNEKAVEKVYALLKSTRKMREEIQDPLLKPIADCSLLLPARVPAYLLSELTKTPFWEKWMEIYEEVYHDETMKQYVSEDMIQKRKQIREAPISGVDTNTFLYEDPLYFSLPEEAKSLPKYEISDDDRLYWWDGSDEIKISEEMDKWLKDLSERYKVIMTEHEEEWKTSRVTVRDFITLFIETEEYYKRIYPFQEMFYEFLENINQTDYRAAMELFSQLADENRKDGEIIKYAKSSWDIASRKITKNIGRLRLKRFLSVMANRKLRKLYFGF